MSVLFITHDLAVVGEIADHVVVMRNGEIREQGPAKQVFETPHDAYTKALLQVPAAARPPAGAPAGHRRLHERPASARDAIPERTRGVTADDPIVLEVRNLGKSFYSREGLFGRREFKAVQERVVRPAEGQDARARRRIRLGQDDGRA